MGTSKKLIWNRKIETGILRTYATATDAERAEGLGWYASAHAGCVAIAQRHGVTVEQAVGVVAAISPGLSWSINLAQADLLIAAYVAGRRLPMVGSYGRRNIRKARRILAGERPLDVLPPTGPKVRAFYACILSPDVAQDVCVDRHAKCLALGIVEDREANSAVKPGYQYNRLAWHYRVLAHRLGLLPHQLQAITWLTWRRLRLADTKFEFHLQQPEVL